MAPARATYGTRCAIGLDTAVLVVAAKEEKPMRTVRALVVLNTLIVTLTAAHAQYREETVTNGGGIAGRVTVDGEIAPLPPLPVFKFHEVCGQTVPDERLVVGKNGALRNALVYLTGVPAGKPIPRDQPVVLDNLKCAFVPHVLAASVGQMLQIHNRDPILHDAHAQIGTETIFNVAVPKGRTVQRPLATPGLAKINCNVRHSWMSAWLLIGENPYHTVTAENGSFRLDDIPAGTYTLHVWHELLGNVERQVKVDSGKTTDVDVHLKSTAAEQP
jgi:hypothetical protein